MQKRKYRRVGACVNVEYSIKGKKSSRELSLKNLSKNLGANGICFAVNEDIGLNTALSMKIYLWDKKNPISARGKVIWKAKFTSLNQSDRYDVGVGFTQISERDQQLLRQYIFELVDKKHPSHK
ncbi:MAG: PilZ domain-containing protein [Candidatus Omnitrophica bacterium]|nr:PilZ domain-containing protein [Candidatus Omnitrophota bacterium]